MLIDLGLILLGILAWWGLKDDNDDDNDQTPRQYRQSTSYYSPDFQYNPGSGPGSIYGGR